MGPFQKYGVSANVILPILLRHAFFCSIIDLFVIVIFVVSSVKKGTTKKLAEHQNFAMTTSEERKVFGGGLFTKIPEILAKK